MRLHFKQYRFATLCLAVFILLCVITLVQSVRLGGNPHSAQAFQLAMMGGTISFLVTASGALPALFIRKIPRPVEDTMLGLAAGMMLAASAFSLLPAGLEAATELTASKAAGVAAVIFGMGLGAILMLSLEKLVPHMHSESDDATGSEGAFNTERVQRMWLFVFAIALHNLPEGMAIGVSFARADMQVGLPLTTAIVMQNIPEGLVVALVLRSIGVSGIRSVLLAGATGLLELFGALLGVGLTSGLAISYPIGLGFAGGAMIFIVSHEVIPETHRNGYQRPATIGLLAGFALMMGLEALLGA